MLWKVFAGLFFSQLPLGVNGKFHVMHTLPSFVDIEIVAKKQKEIILQLQNSSLTFKDIAVIFGFDDSTPLRVFMRPGGQQKTYRRGNKTINRIHQKIMSKDAKCMRVISPALLHNYLGMFAEESKHITYRKRGPEKYSSNSVWGIEDFSSFHSILRDFLYIPQDHASVAMQKFIGNYFFYFPSYRHDSFVKAILRIESEADEAGGSNYRFILYVPNRDYEYMLHRNQDRFRTIEGVVSTKSQCLFFLGTMEGGLASVTLMAPEPNSKVVTKFSGFCTATGETGQLFNAKFVAVRQNFPPKEYLEMDRIPFNRKDSDIDSSIIDLLSENGKLQRSWSI